MTFDVKKHIEELYERQRIARLNYVPPYVEVTQERLDFIGRCVKMHTNTDIDSINRDFKNHIHWVTNNLMAQWQDKTEVQTIQCPECKGTGKIIEAP